jgi:hypothetical protein
MLSGARAHRVLHRPPRVLADSDAALRGCGHRRYRRLGRVGRLAASESPAFTRPSLAACRAACEKASASWTAAWCLELKAASPDRQVAQIRPRSAYGTKYQSLRHIKREGSIDSSQPMTGQRVGPDDRGNRAPPGPLPGPEGKARRVGRSRSRSVIATILALVAERNLRRKDRHSRLSGAHARRRPARQQRVTLIAWPAARRGLIWRSRSFVHQVGPGQSVRRELSGDCSVGRARPRGDLAA